MSQCDRPTQIDNICASESVVLYIRKNPLKHLGDGRVEGQIILKRTLRVFYEDADCIHLVQIRNQWMGLTTMVTNFLVSLDDWKFFEHLGDCHL